MTNDELDKIRATFFCELTTSLQTSPSPWAVVHHDDWSTEAVRGLTRIAFVGTTDNPIVHSLRVNGMLINLSVSEESDIWNALQAFMVTRKREADIATAAVAAAENARLADLFRNAFKVAPGALPTPDSTPRKA